MRKKAEIEPIDQIPEPPKPKNETIEFLKIFGVILAITLVLVWVSSGLHYDQKEAIGKDICKNNSLVYGTLSGDTIICKTNQSYVGEHYNITAPVFELKVKVDWDYYGVGK